MTLIKVPEMNLTVLSLNVQYFSGPENNERTFLKGKISIKEQDHYIDELVKKAYQEDVSVLCLQEIDHESGRTGRRDQAEEVRKKLEEITTEKHYLQFGSCIDLDEGKYPLFWGSARKTKRVLKILGVDTDQLPEDPVRLHFGNATISRSPLSEETHHYYIPRTWDPWMYIKMIFNKDEWKSLLACKLDYCPEIAEKVPLYIYNTHLENADKKNRQYQFKYLGNELRSRENAHKILAGDFNEDPTDQAHRELINQTEIKVYREIDPNIHPQVPPQYITHPATGGALDAVHISEFLEFVSYRIDDPQISDHKMVLAKIKINQDLVPESILRQLFNPLVETP